MHGTAATIEVSTESFTRLFLQPYVIVSWISRSCGVWRAFASVFEFAARRHPDVAFALVDIDREPELASACIIREIPTITAFRRCRLVLARSGFEIDESIDALVRALKREDAASHCTRRTR